MEWKLRPETIRIRLSAFELAQVCLSSPIPDGQWFRKILGYPSRLSYWQIARCCQPLFRRRRLATENYPVSPPVTGNFLKNMEIRQGHGLC
jgi:hypothetical protein